MSDPARRSPLLWGIDGGGTKTTIMLAECVPGQPSNVLASIRAGSSNVNSRPWDDITTELAAAMLTAQQTASIPRQSADVLVAAFAGVGSPAVRAQWENWFGDQKAAREVRIVDDGEPLIAAGLPSGWGVVLICGTGSAAFGRSPSGESARAGGWGYLFGDEGSGFAIGQAALRMLTKTHDRGQQSAPWMRQVADEWKIDRPRELVDRVYRAPEPRQRIAEIAPLVCTAAEAGDHLCQDLLQQAAHDLATRIEIVSERLKISSQPYPLALSGGVIANSSYLRQELLNELSSRGIPADPVTVVREPALGCVELARQSAAC